MHRHILYRSLWLVCAIAYIIFSSLVPFAVVAENADGINESYSREEVTDEMSMTPVRYFWYDNTLEERETEYYDIPLSEDLQDHIFQLCEDKDLDPAIIFGMIEKESHFNADAVGDNGRSIGLMQIQDRWHHERMARLGVYDLKDPFQNVEVGIDILSQLLDCGKSIEWALMAYNGGASYANRKLAKGEVSGYVQKVLENAAKYERKSIAVVKGVHIYELV